MLDVTVITIPGGTKGELQQCCVAKWEGKSYHCFLQVLEAGRNLNVPHCQILNWVGGRGRRRWMTKGNYGQWDILGWHKDY